MAITVDDLKFFQSERMTDFTDGGGQMTANLITSGADNEIFDDISDVDRAAGGVSIRKVYAAVTSDNTDKYLDAGVVLARGPTDPDTSILMFSTGDYYDERDAIRNAVEQYRVRSSNTNLRLIGTHYVNQRVLFGYLLKPITRAIPATFQDQVLCIADDDHEQYVQVIRVRYWPTQYVYLINQAQTLFEVYEVQLDLSGPLDYEFVGSAQSPSGSYEPPTAVYNTQIVAPLTFCGIQPLTAQATSGATAVTVAAVVQKIVPVSYVDLGATLYVPSAYDYLPWPRAGNALPILPINEDWAAPAGFTLDVTLDPPLFPTVNPIPPSIWYYYGGQWIGPDHPNAATYINGTAYFSYMPDADSRVVIEWVGRESVTETLTAANYAYSGTLSTTPIDPGSLVVHESTVYQAVDDGEGVIAGGATTGTINYATGALELTTTIANGSFTVMYTVEDASYARTAFSVLLTAPVKEGSLEISAIKLSDSSPITVSGDSSGTFSDTGVSGTIDYLTGLLTVTFTSEVFAASMEVVYTISGLVPQPKEILGIDTNRLPKTGDVPLYSATQFVLIHNTDTVEEAGLSPTEEVSCGRTNIYRAVIDDADGQRLPSSFYTVDRAAGTVTMVADLNLTGYTGPYTISHTIADLVRLSAVDAGSQVLTLNTAITHTYPADTSFVSNVLYIGDMQARYANLFAQSAWTSVWSDVLIGSEPLAQYNDVTYPLEVTNESAYSDRILLKFTSATAFQAFGEQLGFIGNGTTTEDFAPINPFNGLPRFTLDYRGWGSGWATGNCLRFNLIGANYPVNLLRAIQPSLPTELDDSCELLLIGNYTD